MVDTLITLLEGLGYSVIRQGSLAPDEEYPDTFFTFWSEESGEAYYDDDATAAAHEFDVNVYSTDPDTTYSLLDSARTALKAAGWIILERGYDAQSDEITHTGRGMRVAYIEILS